MSAVKRKMSAGPLAAVARLFSVLSEPSRLVLLEPLREGPLTVSELVKASGMKQANASKHLGMLYQHRLVSRRREGVCIPNEVSDTIVFELINLACEKAARDVKSATWIFDQAD